MVEGLHPHVSQSRSIGCNHASFLARRDNDQRRSKLGRTGPASVHEARTADECGLVSIELPVDPLAHLPNVQPRGYSGPSNNAPPRTSGANRSRVTSRIWLGAITSTNLIPPNVGVGIVEGRVEAFSACDPHKI